MVGVIKSDKSYRNAGSVVLLRRLTTSGSNQPEI